MRPVCALLFVLALSLPLWAAPAAPPQDPLITLMASQPPINTTSPVVATASFDPPVIGPGEQSTYHVTFNALETLIEWPDEISASPQLELRLSARGQIVHPAANGLAPQTAINYRVRASTPGFFAVPAYQVKVNGRPVTVPEARVAAMASPSSPGPELQIEAAETNVFPGQPVTVRVLLPGTAGNVVQAMSQVQLNGDGFLVDESSVHQTIKMVSRDQREIPAFVYEATVIPLEEGTLSITAQGFTSGNQFGGPIVIQAPATIPGGPPQYVLLDSDPVTVNVRPLPPEGQLPGFTGAIGSLRCDPPKLATNSVRVGDPVKLIVTVHGDNNLARLTGPPPPQARDWQVFGPITDDAAPGSSGPAGEVKTFTYTLLPLTQGTRTTPAIPFSYFNPGRNSYVDLTIPAVPVTVNAGAAPTEPLASPKLRPAVVAREMPPALSDLAGTPGRMAGSLVPLQWRRWFMVVQLAPVALFAGLWVADRRRFFLEQHPGILLRRRARRALRQEWRALRKAAGARDAPRFAASAVNAMRAACAPHYPAEPRALVCSDVLQLLGELDPPNGFSDVVRRFFAVTDASRFAGASADTTALLPLHSELEQVLERLEERL